MGLADKLKKAKAKVEKEKESQGDYSKVNWFKAETGKNHMRIVPNKSKDEDGDPILFVEKSMHYGLPITKKDGGILKISARCLKDFDKECPMCMRYAKLIEEGDKDAARQIKASSKYYYNILNYKTQKVEVLQAGVTIHNDILDLTDMDVEFWDVEDGLDLVLHKEVEAGKPAMFGTSYKMKPHKLKTSAVPSKLRSLLKEVYELEDINNEDQEDRMIEVFGGKKAKKATKSDEAVESHYEEEEKEEEVQETSPSKAGEASDDELDEELKALGL